jgi:hypothetical protein
MCVTFSVKNSVPALRTPETGDIAVANGSKKGFTAMWSYETKTACTSLL